MPRKRKSSAALPSQTRPPARLRSPTPAPPQTLGPAAAALVRRSHADPGCAAELRVEGELEDTARSWTVEERRARRRLVQFAASRAGGAVTAARPGEGGDERFFKVITGFANPKPVNITKDVKGYSSTPGALPTHCLDRTPP
ncbi:hypothetical protein BDY21DRAFT_375457 [Lineolata rhizophorae]|uniref:Uncharacterized protein n=1 Tax=Lineolata rhizophorae TaxID=578093 RepID=A0A6A6NLE0_9PEZI|nr:hypothetical protein BDY21DRAFT_375457 [Lineolata rhizophorae]